MEIFTPQNTNYEITMKIEIEQSKNNYVIHSDNKSSLKFGRLDHLDNRPGVSM